MIKPFNRIYTISVSYKLILINLILCFSNSLLADDLAWKKLLLYQRDGRTRSLIDKDSKYFRSKNGFKNHKEEYEASLKMFLNPENVISQGQGHPQCLYPYRFKYLSQRTGLRFLKVECPALEEWKNKLKTEKVTIVYASQFVSNPASVMGHTFLKFSDSSVTDFLDITVGYAANVDDKDNAFRYAYKGLTGKYNGRIFDNPYYEKVHEYSNMEQRDIWEYDLNLSIDQIDNFLNLLWELKSTSKFEYYFLDENCSFMLLAFIEAVLPESDLTSGLGFYIPPYMTLKRLKEAGLIARESFRPSLRTKMLAEYESLSENDKKSLPRDFRNFKISPGKSADYYDAYITATLYEKHRNEGVISEKRAKVFKEALVSRSQLGQKAGPIIPRPDSVLDAHNPKFIEYGVGNTSIGSYQNLKFRPGIHTINDLSVGFLPNSSFNFLETQGRYYKEERKAKISNLVLFELQSTNILHRMDPKLSWKVKSQYLDRELLALDKEIYEAEFLIGTATKLFGLDVIVLPGIKEQVSPGFADSHITWVKSDLKVRKDFSSFLLDFSPTISKAIINGPDSMRLDIAFELRLRLQDYNFQVAPKLNFQRLLNGKKSYFDHNLNLIYDF